MRLSTFVLFALSACTAGSVDSRLSGVVAFSYSRPGIAAWLTHPTQSTIEAWAWFPRELGDDVIFGIDQEFLDGQANPLYVPKGDWMALVGVQRSGKVWVASGTAATLAGMPSTDRAWLFDDLGAPLQPETWYRFRTVADFEARHYVSFSVEGPGVNKTIDLRAVAVDFPNAAPFSARAMTFYVFSLRGKSLGGELTTSGAVSFDDVVARTTDTVFEEGFEADAGAVPNQPIDLAALPASGFDLNAYVEHRFYLERADSRCRVAAVATARTGHQVCQCDATLKNVSYGDWLTGG